MNSRLIKDSHPIGDTIFRRLKSAMAALCCDVNNFEFPVQESNARGSSCITVISQQSPSITHDLRVSVVEDQVDTKGTFTLTLISFPRGRRLDMNQDVTMLYIDRGDIEHALKVSLLFLLTGNRTIAATAIPKKEAIPA